MFYLFVMIYLISVAIGQLNPNVFFWYYKLRVMETFVVCFNKWLIL